MHKNSTSFFTDSPKKPISNNLPRLKSYLIMLLVYKLYKTVDALIMNTNYDVMEIIARRKYVDQLKQGQIDKLHLGMSFAKDQYDIATTLVRDAQSLLKLEVISSPSCTQSAPVSIESRTSIDSSQEPTSQAIPAYVNISGCCESRNNDTDSEDSYEFTPEPKPKLNTLEEKNHINKTQSERDLQSINAMIARRLINSKSTPPSSNTSVLTCKFEEDFTTGFKDIESPKSNNRK